MTVVGRATVEVSPDASGFGPKTEAAIKKALAGVAAKVDLHLDESGLRSKIAAAVTKAGAGANIKIGADVDTSPIQAKVAKAVAAAATDVKMPVEVDIDPLDLIAKVEAAQAAAKGAAGERIQFDFELEGESELAAKANAVLEAVSASLPGLDVEVKLDDDELRRDVTAAVAKAGVNQKVRVGLEVDEKGGGGGGGGGGSADRVGAAAGGIFGRAVLRTAARVLAAGGLAQVFIAATSGAVAIGSALTAATAAAGSLVSTVAVLPGLLSGAAQAAASIGFALSGVGTALKAHEAMQKAVGKAAASEGDSGTTAERAARTSERAIRDATRGIADAEEAMAEAVEAANERAADAAEAFADAQQDAADVVERAAERIADSEQNLADAHRRTQEAQEDLTRARREAADEINDLRDSVESLALSEEDAALRVAEAEARLREGRQGRSTHPVLGEDVTKVNLADRNRAERDALNLKRAQLGLVEATKRRVEAQEKLNKAEAAGVDGSEKVINATERLESARRNEAEAIRDNARAHREASRSIADANERVADSQAELVRAQRDVSRAHTEGAERVALAQERLADAIEDAAFRSATGTRAVAGATDTYQAALNDLNPAARRFTEFLVSLKPRLKEIQATAAAGLLPGLEQAIRTLLPVLDDFEPILFDTGQALAGLAIDGANLIASPAFRGDLITIGRRNIDLLRTFGNAAISAGDGLRHVVIAAGPLAQHLADLTEHYASVFREQAAIGRESGRLEAFFERVRDRIDKVVLAVQFLATGLFRVFRDAMPTADRYLEQILRLSAAFDIITRRASEKGTLRDFFENARPAVEEIFRLVGDLGTGLFKLGNDNLAAFTAFVQQLRTELLPVLLEVLGKIDVDFLSALVDLTGALANLFGAILTNNPVLTTFVTVLGDMADGISRLLSDIPILSPILQGLVTLFGALAVVGAVTALKDFASSVFGVEKALKTMSGAASDADFKGSKLGKTYDAVGKILGRAFVGAAVVLAFKAAIDALAPSVDKLAGAVARSNDPLKEFDKQLRKLNNPSVFEQIALGFKKIIEDPFRRHEGISKFATSSTDAFKKVAEASQAQALRVIADAKAQGRATGEFERILESLIQEKARQSVAEEDVSKKIADATSAIRGNNVEMQRHIDQLRRATDQALSLSGAEIGTEEAIDRLTESLERNGLTFDTNSEAGRENKRALDTLIGSVQAEVTELGKAAAAGELNNERKQRLLDHLNELARSGYPGAKEAAARLRSELETIERTYTAEVDLDVRRAQEKIASLQRQLNSINAQTVEGEEAGARQSSGVQREFGGRVLRNAAYIVGEKRPELFIPDQNGVILPSVPDLADPTGLNLALPDTTMVPLSDGFDFEGLEAALRSLEEALTQNLADLQAEDFRPAPEPERGRSEQSDATAEFDYERLATVLDRHASRTVNINTEVTAALPAEVGTDTARNLRNAIYLEMGD